MNDSTLLYISNLVKEGFVNGFYPNWMIEYSGIHVSEISDYSLTHIGDCIEKGFVQGEVQEDEKSGWWKLNYQLD